jgi:hypothetical protein
MNSYEYTASFRTRKCRYNFPTKTFSNMKLITHVLCFMLNTWPSQQVLKLSTLGFQTCLHTTFHISKSVIAWISLSTLFRKSCCVRSLFPYTQPLRMPHRKKSNGVTSGDLGDRSHLGMISVLKKGLRWTDSRQECLNRFTLAHHTNTISYPDRSSYRHNWH